MKKTRKLRRNKKCSYVNRGGGDGSYSEENFITQMKFITTLKNLKKQSDKAITTINAPTTDTLIGNVIGNVKKMAKTTIETAQNTLGTKKYNYEAVKEFLPELEEFYKITNSTPPLNSTSYTTGGLISFLEDLKKKIEENIIVWKTENPLIVEILTELEVLEESRKIQRKYAHTTGYFEKNNSGISVIYDLKKGQKYYIPAEGNEKYPHKTLDTYYGTFEHDDHGRKKHVFYLVDEGFKDFKIIEDSERPTKAEYLTVLDVTDIIKTAGGSRKTRRYRKSKAKGMKKRSLTKK